MQPCTKPGVSNVRSFGPELDTKHFKFYIRTLNFLIPA